MYTRPSNFHPGRNIAGAVGLAFIVSLALPLASANAGGIKARGATTQLGLKSNGGGTVHDFQCGSSSTPACDDDFAAKCKKAGGTLSGTLPFGGKNCATPGGW
jgi:hypothetical protein